MNFGYISSHVYLLTLLLLLLKMDFSDEHVPVKFSMDLCTCHRNTGGNSRRHVGHLDLWSWHGDCLLKINVTIWSMWQLCVSCYPFICYFLINGRFGFLTFCFALSSTVISGAELIQAPCSRLWSLVSNNPIWVIPYFQNKAFIVAELRASRLSAVCNMLLGLLEKERMTMCDLAAHKEACLCPASVYKALVAGCL